MLFFFSSAKLNWFLLLFSCVFPCTHFGGWSIWRWLWVTACAGLSPITAQLPVYLIFCVCKQPFYDITWEQPADMCWLVQRGKKTADFAGQGGAKLFVLCYFGLGSASELFVWVCWQWTNPKPLWCCGTWNTLPFTSILWSLQNVLFPHLQSESFGFASLRWAFAIGVLLQKHLAAWQSPLYTCDTDMSNLLQAEATIRQVTAAGRDLFPKLFLWGRLLMQHIGAGHQRCSWSGLGMLSWQLGPCLPFLRLVGADFSWK